MLVEILKIPQEQEDIEWDLFVPRILKCENTDEVVVGIYSLTLTQTHKHTNTIANGKSTHILLDRTTDVSE